MLRFGYAILVGLVGAAIVHIAVLLLVPAYSAQDAWSTLSRDGDLFELVRLPGGSPRSKGGRAPDPFIAAAACRFDLAGDGGARLSASAPALFWSVSVYNRRGHNVYNLNDRSASDGALDIALVSPARMLELRKGLPEDMDGATIIEVEDDLGIIVVRTFRPDPTFVPAIEAFFESARCEPR